MMSMSENMGTVFIDEMLAGSNLDFLNKIQLNNEPRIEPEGPEGQNLPE